MTANTQNDDRVERLNAVLKEFGFADGPVEIYSPSGVRVLQRGIERLAAQRAALIDALSVLAANAVLAPDPRMEGLADCYLVPIDDIEEARAALARATGGQP